MRFSLLRAGLAAAGLMLLAGCVTYPYETGFASCDAQAGACYQDCEVYAGETGYGACHASCEARANQCFATAYGPYRSSSYYGGYAWPWYGDYGVWGPQTGFIFSFNYGGYDRYRYNRHIQTYRPPVRREYHDQDRRRRDYDDRRDFRRNDRDRDHRRDSSGDRNRPGYRGATPRTEGRPATPPRRSGPVPSHPRAQPSARPPQGRRNPPANAQPRPNSRPAAQPQYESRPSGAPPRGRDRDAGSQTRSSREQPRRRPD